MARASAVSADDLSGADKRELVQRILRSPLFSSSQALQAFLVYIAEYAIAGRVEEIREQRIGCVVLGRKPDYDPAVDNIVRVRAHELRKRLGKYFSTTGAHEPFIISIPVGAYVPNFEARAVAVRDEVEPAPAGEGGRIPRWPSWTNGQLTAIRDFWGQFFPKSGQDLTVVAADAAFALWQDIEGLNLSLGEYLSRRYLEIGDPRLREVAARRCMAPSDLDIALRLVGVCDIFGGQVKAQYARNLSISYFHGASAVLLGSRRSNPWVQLFEPRLNFVLARDPPSEPRFQNTSPQPGEPTSFGIPCHLEFGGTEQMEMESYALVALVPGLSGMGRVVILEGLNMQATEAAGEMVTNPELLEALLRQIGHKPGTSVRPCEALITLISMPGGYVNPQLVAFRHASTSPDA